MMCLRIVSAALAFLSTLASLTGAVQQEDKRRARVQQCPPGYKRKLGQCIPNRARLLPVRSLDLIQGRTSLPTHAVLDKRPDTALSLAKTSPTVLQANLGNNYQVTSIQVAYRNRSSRAVSVAIYDANGTQVARGILAGKRPNDGILTLYPRKKRLVPIGSEFKLVFSKGRSFVKISEVAFFGGSTLDEASQKTINWGLAVIVDFADSKLEDYKNASGINNVQDLRHQLDLMESHWIWMSRGQHKIEWAIERVTLDKNLDPNQYNNDWVLFRNTTAIAITNKVNISDYDSNGDGVLDHTWLILASKETPLVGEYFYLSGGRSMNKNVDMFVDGQGNLAATLACTGCFNHEVAHTDAIGLHDLYGDYSNLGQWSIMSYNWGDNIGGFLAWELKKLGWLMPRIVSGSTTILSLLPMEQGGESMQVETGNPDEYFMLEYHKRPQSGWGSGWEADVDGILITHIVESKAIEPGPNVDDPPGIRIEPADGNLNYNEWPNETDLWYPENSLMLVSFEAKLYGDAKVIFRVHNFVRNGDQIQMDVTFTQ